jgi:hypothetical protein
MRRLYNLLCLIALFPGRVVFAADLPARVEFNRDIRPILSENCYQCHGPDKNTRKADLRLDTKEGLFAEIDGNRPVVAGDLDKSEMYRRLITDDTSERMPNKKSGKKLTAKQIALIKLWIEQGAQWQGHWAYIKPNRPTTPEIQQPVARNPIDLFVFAKLKENKLKPSAEADRVTLIRRLFFDLIGLPPSPQQVADFVNDQSPNAYEKVVEQLLASPHFGERMAIHWLDLVRFADSIGYHSDNPRDIAPYRDYVIKAFNENKRFDQFTIEQLAGDLLPNATMEQKVATGYNRLLQTTEEGGAQPKEYAAKYLADRVRNVSSVWLGATMGCSECHDHKFDPYTARDFYSMEAFFADVKEAAVGRREPGMPVPDEKQAAEMKRLEDLVAQSKAKLAADTPELAAAQVEWEKSLLQKGYRHVDWVTLAPIDVVAASGGYPKVNDDKSINITRFVLEKDAYTIRVKTNLKGITAFRLDALTDGPDKKTGPGRGAGGVFTLTSFSVTAGAAAAKAEPDPSLQAINLQNASASYEAPRKLDKTAATFSAASALTPDSGWSNAGYANKDIYAVFETAENFGDGKDAYLTFTLRFDAGKKQSLNRFKLSATTAARPVKANPGQELPKDIATILVVDAEKRSEEQKKKIAAYHRNLTPVLQPLRDAVAKSEKARDEFLKSVPRSLITVAENPRPVRILPRGNWLDDSGEIVQPAFPAFLTAGKAPTTQPRLTRLDLARWITSAGNPLASRVFANRLWRLYFGTGISKSVEDFGAQGEWPTHPELLDYLATEFVQSGWDIKHMIRLMVTSTTYRQTSRPTKDLVEKDPFNRLYARQSRFRLDAEIVRDNALAVSGLLNLKIGGPSAKQYQPDGYWEYLNFPKRTWEQDHGENLYRRGLYTWWQRSFMHPSLLTFDAPSREECTAERARSNTPQQALTLLNDPTYVEAARVFAEHIVREGGQSTPDRLRWAFVRTLSRDPNAQELSVLQNLFEKHQSEFAADKDAAKKLIASGEAPVAKELDAAEVAAWTSVARALLNLHETITRN